MAADIKQLAGVLGKPGIASLPCGIDIACTIVNVRTAYGRTDVLIRPVAGQGEAWLSAKRVRIFDAAGELYPVR